MLSIRAVQVRLQRGPGGVRVPARAIDRVRDVVSREGEDDVRGGVIVDEDAQCGRGCGLRLRIEARLAVGKEERAAAIGPTSEQVIAAQRHF